MSFDKGFDIHACVGDSIQCEVKGFTVTARLVHDEDANVDEYDCYNEDEVAAWKRDDWSFVGVVLDLERDGWNKPHVASLWAVECNFPDTDNTYLLDVANDLLAEVPELQ